MSRPCTIQKAVQLLHYMHEVQSLHYTQSFVGPAPYAGLYRPCTIHRSVLALYYTQGCTGSVLYAGLYRPCTIRSAVQALNYI